MYIYIYIYDIRFLVLRTSAARSIAFRVTFRKPCVTFRTRGFSQVTYVPTYGV